MIEAIKCQRDHLDGMCVRVARLDRSIVAVQINSSRITIPVAQPLVAPGNGYVKEAFMKRALWLGLQIRFRYPKESVGCLAVGHRQRLEVQSFGFRALSQQLPIVTAVIDGRGDAISYDAGKDSRLC